MARYLMAQAGLKDDDASFIGIGAGPTAVAAARRGEIDALVNVDPVISVLESDKTIKVVADTRTLEGTRAVFGGRLPDILHTDRIGTTEVATLHGLGTKVYMNAVPLDRYRVSQRQYRETVEPFDHRGPFRQITIGIDEER